jgi:hypothetical protein
LIHVAGKNLQINLPDNEKTKFITIAGRIKTREESNEVALTAEFI